MPTQSHYLGHVDNPADAAYEARKPLCKTCGKQKRAKCNDGWLDALGPYPDGSYITSRPCPNGNVAALPPL